MSNVLVLIEHANGQPKKLSLNAITFGQQLCAKTGGKLNLLVVGSDAATAANALTGFGAEKVLVIDDDSIVLDVMVDILEQKSHCVLSASDGQQGLDSFQAEPQDVVITDIQLSVKTGLDMIRELRDRHPDVKLIATASLGHPFLARAIDAGAPGLPVTPSMDMAVESTELVLNCRRVLNALWKINSLS